MNNQQNAQIANSPKLKGGVFPRRRDKLCTKDSFVINEIFVFLMEFFG